MGLSGTVSDISSDISRKWQIFRPQVFSADSSLELDTDGRGQKTIMMGLPDGQQVLR